MGLSRETRVRPGYGHLYPEIRPGWDAADAVARRIAERILAQQGYVGVLKGRVLPERHFEFRGGSSIRPGGLHSRLSDGRR
jgi:hypothetical protein